MEQKFVKNRHGLDPFFYLWSELAICFGLKAVKRSPLSYDSWLPGRLEHFFNFPGFVIFMSIMLWLTIWINLMRFFSFQKCCLSLNIVWHSLICTWLTVLKNKKGNGWGGSTTWAWFRGGVIFLSKTSQFRAEKRHILTKISQNTIYCPQFGLRISELIAFNCSNKNT